MSLSALIKAVKRTDLLVTPPLTTWLFDHPDLVLAPDVARRLVELMTKKPRDRSGNFDSSGRGSCLRAQMLQFLGYPKMVITDVKTSSIFIDGVWRHLRWQGVGLTAGFISDIEVGWNIPTRRVTGSMDGTNEPDLWGWEHKGVMSWAYENYVNKKREPMPKHMLQLATYSVGRPELERFALTYENKDTHDWHEWVFTPDELPREEALHELDILNRHVANRELPEVLDDCKTTPDRKCDFRRVCHGACFNPRTEQAGKATGLPWTPAEELEGADPERAVAVHIATRWDAASRRRSSRAT